MPLFKKLANFLPAGITYVHIIITCFTLSIVWFLLNRRKDPNIPIVNEYAGDYSFRKAHAEFMTNARGLLIEGARKFQGPFRVITPLGARVILPSSYTEWIRTCNDLDHHSLVIDEYFANYPGMEGNGVIHESNNVFVNITKQKLNQSSQCKTMHEHATEVLQELWSDAEEYHPIPWHQTAVHLIARLSSSIISGPDLARSPEWQTLIITYTQNLFQAVRALRSWPAPLRPLVHWFLPECRTCRTQVQRAREMLAPVLAQRAATKKSNANAANDSLQPRRSEDALDWAAEMAAAAGLTASSSSSSNALGIGNGSGSSKHFDLVATQLGFAIAALHTTSELLRQTLLDIGTHTELIEPLREEVSAAINAHGWTTAGLFAMPLLDSVLKETQRLKPGTLVNLERKVVRDVWLPLDYRGDYDNDGVRRGGKSSGDSGGGGGGDGDVLLLRKGTNVAVDSSAMWHPSVHHEPERYDGYRFLRMREAGNKAAALVSSSAEHFAFGMGKPVCPGRFFAANELKVALAVILLQYDVRLMGDRRPKVLEMGWEMLSDPDVKLEVRRRRA